jgi:hypothetical protein
MISQEKGLLELSKEGHWYKEKRVSKNYISAYIYYIIDAVEDTYVKKNLCEWPRQCSENVKKMAVQVHGCRTENTWSWQCDQCETELNEKSGNNR